MRGDVLVLVVSKLVVVAGVAVFARFRLPSDPFLDDRSISGLEGGVDSGLADRSFSRGCSFVGVWAKPRSDRVMRFGDDNALTIRAVSRDILDV